MSIVREHKKNNLMLSKRIKKANIGPEKWPKLQESRWNLSLTCYHQTAGTKFEWNAPLIISGVSVRMMMSVDGRRLLYLSLWRHLLLGGGKLLLQPGGRKWHHRLQLLGVGFGRDVLLLVRVLEAIFGEMGHLREREESVTPENLVTTIHLNSTELVVTQLPVFSVCDYGQLNL